MAYCLEGGSLCSKGDVLKVVKVVDNYIACGDGRTQMATRRFARVLTVDEIVNLPMGSEVVRVRELGRVSAGERHVKSHGGGLVYQHMLYALLSLPKPEQDDRIKRMEIELKDIESAASTLREELKEMKS